MEGDPGLPEPSASDVSGGRLLRNTLANGVGSVVLGVLAIVVTPLLLDGLGNREYGVWLLAGSLTFQSGYLGLADLGLQQAGVRYVAQARAAGDLRAVDEAVSTLTAVFVLLGIIVAVAMASMAEVFVHVFNIEPHLQALARATFVIVGVQLAVDLPAAASMSVVEGAQRFGSLRAVETGTRLLVAIGSVWVVTDGRGPVALAVVGLIVAVGGFVTTIALARRAQPGLRIRPSLVSLSMARGLGRYAAPLTVMRLLSVIYRQMDRIIVGVLISAAAVAEYEVTYKIHALALIVLALGPSAILPAASQLGAAQDRVRMQGLYLRGTRYAIAMSLPVTVSAIFHTPAIVRSWVGPEYLHLVDETRLFLVYPLLVAIHTVGLTMLVGIGRMRELVGLNVLSVVLNLVLSVALATHLGLVGVIWGTLAGYAILWVPYLRLMTSEFETSASAVFRSSVLPNLLPLVAQLAFLEATRRWIGGSAHLVVVGGGLAMSWVVFLVVFVLLRPRSEQRSLASAIRFRPAAT